MMDMMKDKTPVLIFWGTGKIGSNILKMSSFFGVRPDYLTDNNPELWGTERNGVTIISPDELFSFPNLLIFITCNKVEEIRLQIREMGITADVCSGTDFCDMLKNNSLFSDMISRQCRRNLPKTGTSLRSVFFMLDSGLILGGAEAWAVENGKKLKALGYPVRFVVPESVKDRLSVDKEDVIRYMTEGDYVENMLRLLTEILHLVPCTIVCNFPYYLLDIARIIKLVLPEMVTTLAVLHNDEQVIYDGYIRGCGLVDRFTFISTKMKQEMLQRGFPEEKMVYLPWKIPCRTDLKKEYSGSGEPLRIGYAGRVTVKQKRLDLLPGLLEELVNKGIRFIIEVAGDGDFAEELRRQLHSAEMDGFVRFDGMLNRNEMDLFWNRQDIGIMVSDWEGRSISKAEAMANGAVPVVTDTSGARDDIEDGYNGFVVGVGDIDGMAEIIKIIYEDRELLSYMGKRAHETILKNNAKYDFEGFWKPILAGE